jgi:hypothetical protein
MMRNINKVGVNKPSSKKRGRPKKEYEEPDVKKITRLTIDWSKFYNPIERKRARNNIRYLKESEQRHIIETNGLFNYSCQICELQLMKGDEFKFRFIPKKYKKMIKKMKPRPNNISPNGEYYIICKEHKYILQTKLSQYF